MTFTNLEKYVYSKTMLKTTTSTPLPIPPAKSKVFSSQKSHLATAVFCNWICLFSRQSNKTFRLSFILKGYFLQPRIRKTGYFQTAEFLNNCHKSLNMYSTTQQNCIYTGLTSLSLISTRVIALVPTSTSASIKLISVLLVWSRGIRCAYWDHEEKKQKVCFVTHSFLNKIWDYLKFQGFSVKRLW